MAHTYDELHKKTVAELRDIAKDLDHEAVQGYTQMNKDHLLPAICEALDIKIDKHHHHEATGIDKKNVKDKLKELRAEKQKAIDAGDHARLKELRRRYHNLNHKIRAATTA
jgi:DNA polymerase/3'-5' exonuclease PolX